MLFSDAPFPVLGLWSLWLLIALTCVINALDFGLRIERQERRFQKRIRRSGPYTPPAVVIVPVKGRHDRLRSHVAALADQDYPNYRVQYVVESPEDPVFEQLRELGCEPLVAGRSEHGGQKVHNLLVGLDSLGPDDEVVVFADADGNPSNSWLRRLVDPIQRARVGATTTYRWLLPGEGLASAFMAILNRSVGTLIGSGWRTFAWGGSMGMHRTVIDEVNLREYWRGALSDDYRLSAAIRKAGKRIDSLATCCVASPITASWASLWEFGRRQYLITRLHVPWVWWVALLSTGVYTGAFLCAVGLMIGAGPQAAGAGAVFLAVFVLDVLRGILRIRGGRKLFSADVPATDWRTGCLELLCTPLWMALHFLIILSSAFGRRITWAGITYDLHQPQDVRVVARS